MNIPFGLKVKSKGGEKKRDRKRISSNGNDFTFGDLQDKEYKKKPIQFDPTVCVFYTKYVLVSFYTLFFCGFFFGVAFHFNRKVVFEMCVYSR